MINISISHEHKIKVNGYFISVDIPIEKGKITQLVGPNGIGKSTIIQYLKSHQSLFLANEHCYFLDQGRLSPLNQVCFKDLKKILLHMRFEELSLFLKFEKLLENYSHIPLNDLSGGQNQMVKIALSLYLSGTIFIYDEPFQFLDKENHLQFLNVLNELKRLQKGVLIIEHQVNLTDIVHHVSKVKTVSLKICNNGMSI